MPTPLKAKTVYEISASLTPFREKTTPMVVRIPVSKRDFLQKHNIPFSDFVRNCIDELYAELNKNPKPSQKK